MFTLIQDGSVIYYGPDDPRVPVAPPPAPVSTPAYDNPTLTVDQVKPATVDGATVQVDGSVWDYSSAAPPVPGFDPGPTRQGWGPTPTTFGYLSPEKTPPVWSWAQAHMPPKGPGTDGPGLPQSFEAWNATWENNKYGLYRADPLPLIASGQMTIVLFGELVVPYRTYIQ